MSTDGRRSGPEPRPEDPRQDRASSSWRARLVVEGFVSGLHRSPTRASASSSRSTASTSPATTSGTSTGSSGAARTASTSRSTRRRPTSAPGCSSIRASRWPTATTAGKSFDYARTAAPLRLPDAGSSRTRSACRCSPTKCNQVSRRSNTRANLGNVFQTLERRRSPTGKTKIGEILHELASSDPASAASDDAVLRPVRRRRQKLKGLRALGQRGHDVADRLPRARPGRSGVPLRTR